MTSQDRKQKENQYWRETSQIHAPADLILRTKQAVAAEEERLRQESAAGSRQPAPQAGTSETAGEASGRIRSDRQQDNQKAGVRRGYMLRLKWIVPVAAAAMLVFVLYVSRVPFLASRNKGGEAGAAAPAEYESAAFEGDTLLADEAMDSEESMTAADEAEEEGDAATDSAAGGEEGTAPADRIGIGEEKTTESREEEATGQDGDSASKLEIREIAKEPDFCRMSDTERVESHGVPFYIAENEAAERKAGEKNAWKAYVEYDGKRYLITGAAAGREEFLEEAYALLVK